MGKKNITINDLAKMVKKGFDETAKTEEMNFRFKEANSRFDKVENRLEKIEQANEDIKLRLGNTAFQFDPVVSF